MESLKGIQDWFQAVKSKRKSKYQGTLGTFTKFSSISLSNFLNFCQKISEIKSRREEENWIKLTFGCVVENIESESNCKVERQRFSFTWLTQKSTMGNLIFSSLLSGWDCQRKNGLKKWFYCKVDGRRGTNFWGVKWKVISALINSFLIFLISLDQYLLFDHQCNQNRRKWFIVVWDLFKLFFKELHGKFFKLINFSKNFSDFVVERTIIQAFRLVPLLIMFF